MLGSDVAGVVEAIGDRVTTQKPGDKVFGISYGYGAFAEYMCVSEKELVLVPMPPGTSFEEAACTPGSSYLALYWLKTLGRLKPGQRVLINGASGGIGTFAVQIARWIGAEVTAVCSIDNLEMVRGIGAQRVIDYTREDFTQSGEKYDLIFDVAAKRSFGQCRSVMTHKGAYITTAVRPDLVIMGLLSRLGNRRFHALIPPKLDQRTLRTVSELLATKTIRPVISEHYTLAQVPEALRKMGTGHTPGKMVIVP